MNIDDIPRFNLTSEIFGIQTRLSNAIEECRNISDTKMMMRLGKTSLIRSVNSSLAIEGNGLEPFEVVDIVNNRTVIGPFDEIVETRNALEAYNSLDDYDVWSIGDFLRAQDVMMFGLVETPGFRDHEVVVAEEERVIYRAPRYEEVAPMMDRLFEWGRSSMLPSTITGAVVHYYIESIHPFPDGNGRMGRLWNTAILCRSDPIYGMISLESQIFRRRREYYDVLESCQHNTEQDCSEFIVFIMDCLADAFTSLSHVTDRNISKLLECMDDRAMSSGEIMERMGLAHKSNFMKRYLNPAIDLGLVFRTESSPNSRNQVYRRMVR